MTAFQTEFLALAPMVRAYAMIVTHGRASAADDLAQDTLELAWRARDQFQPGTSMKAWMFTILRNARHSQWRRTRRELEDPEGTHAAGRSCEAIQEWHAQFSDLLDAVNRLDADSRLALLLVTMGLTYEETAQACGSPLRTVQSRVRRARLRLAETTMHAEPQTTAACARREQAPAVTEAVA
ncbi:sigma-70 family RNA polymerase sigma factor [Brevundimonas sp.]|uniref:sigma-70 family RNA polymerase sigma factor n=1 Tax=Brevundimonas sp. TaxID=1871086 RepID=UPI002E0ECBDF|nr:sigma-70 family RNA polymerase sigma factor [Brevundimonas sp.]